MGTRSITHGRDPAGHIRIGRERHLRGRCQRDGPALRWRAVERDDDRQHVGAVGSVGCLAVQSLCRGAERRHRAF